MSDFLDFGKTLLNFGAPLIGTALGGPLGGAAAGMIAKAITGAGGTVTGHGPAELKLAFEQLDPAAQAKAASAAEQEWAKALQEEWRTAGIAVQEINQTARNELLSQDRFVRWARPSSLYVFSFSALLFCLVLVGSIAAIVWRFDAAGIATAITALVGLIGSLAMLLGVIAFPATGYVMSRGREKQTAMTGEANPGIVGTLLGALKK